MRDGNPRILEIQSDGFQSTVHLKTGQVRRALDEDQAHDLGHHETVELSLGAHERRTNTLRSRLEGVPLFDSHRFSLEDEIGRGGMSIVHSVFDRLLKRSLAMKVISTRVMTNEEAISRFIAEAQIMSSLQHPSIIPVHDIGRTEDGKLYFMMEAVAGQTMKHHIVALHEASEPMRWSYGEWSLNRLLDALYRVCETIGHVHEKGVCHLDIKPLNVQLGDHGEVWVLDWGLARQAGGFDEDIWCTAQYTAPQRAMGHQTFACDVYALGCVLYEILAGVPPFHMQAAEDIFAALREAEIPKLSEQTVHQRPLPQELVSLCERCMRWEPEERPTIEGLTTALREWLDGSRRKARAQELVERALASKARSVELEEQSQGILKTVKLLQANLPEHPSIESKYPLWDLEHQSREVHEESERTHEEHLLLLKQALLLFQNTYEASIPLIDHCITEHRVALQRKRHARAYALQSEARRYMELLPEQHPVNQRARAYFEGRSSLSVQVPKGSSVILESFSDNRKRRQAKVVDIQECSGLYARELEVGSYRLRILKTGFDEVRYPVFLEHGSDWKAAFDPDAAPKALPLPCEGEVRSGDSYVPESWFYCSGDEGAPNALAEERVWVDGFVISQTPVTHGDYLDFLNDTLEVQGAEVAGIWVPREQNSREGEDGSSVYTFESGRFHHPKGEAFHAHPVVQVTWHSAVAYTQWLSKKSGKQWRLPMELEWEKAARGVDRRFFPWGDEFDPSFCVMMDSHSGEPEIKSVHHQPLDVSVYGVVSCAGNTREWCLDLFSGESLPIVDHRLRLPSAEDLSAPGFRSSRGGSFGNAAARTRSADRDWWFPQLSYIGRGFRVARSWPPSAESEALHARITCAHQARLESLREE